MMARNSPSSIITYLQCPRLYYYQYIERRPSVPHLDLIRGSTVHSTLQEFFIDPPSSIEKNYDKWANDRIEKLFKKNWDMKKQDIQQTNMPEKEVYQYYAECLEMLHNWLNNFLIKIERSGISFRDAFLKFKPITEKECYVEKFDIKGFIDVIENDNGEIRIIDYKTSSKFEITNDQKLQLAIYAYLYENNFGKRPNKVGIYFLKENLHLISVDEAMLRYAEEQCKMIYEKTQSRNIKDYTQNMGYLCKLLKGDCPCRQFE